MCTCDLSAQVPSGGGVESVANVVGGDHLVTEIEALVREKMVRRSRFGLLLFLLSSFIFAPTSIDVCPLVGCRVVLFVSLGARHCMAH